MLAEPSGHEITMPSAVRQIGTSFPLGRHDLSGRRQLQRVLEKRHRRAAALLRSGGCRDAGPSCRSRPADAALVPLLARIRARHRGRAALRLPRRWAVRSRPRSPLRPRQGAPRSVRQMRGAACGVESRGGMRARRQLRLGSQERRRRPRCIRLGGRSSSAHALCQDGCLRDARGRLHAAPQLRRRGVEARHVCGRDRQDSVPAGPGYHRRRAAAGVRLRRSGCAARRERLGLPAGLVLRTPSGL